MSKAQRLTEIIRSQIEDFAAYPEEWMRFLMSPSSQNYKLRFDEKVMLYHEAPDASPVATMELWNKLNIGVKRGSKGILVLAGEPGSDGKVKYYFSVKDTINRGQTAVFLPLKEEFNYILFLLLFQEFCQLHFHVLSHLSRLPFQETHQCLLHTSDIVSPVQKH